MTEVKSLIICPEQRTVLPGIFKHNHCPNPDRTAINAYSLPGKHIMLRITSKRPQRAGFRMQHCYGVLCGAHMVVGYDAKRDRFHDVSLLDADELASMVEWVPRFAGLMTSSVWKRLDTHRPLVDSGDARSVQLDCRVTIQLLPAA